MEFEIAAHLPLDSVTFRISPQNRYDAFIGIADKEEQVGCGLIHHLILHLPQLKDSYNNGSCSDIKLQLPQNPADTTWFTKATLTRFLMLIESGDALKKSISIKDEMSQLEETRAFHLSLYAKAENGAAPSDDSKNVLLRAMDLRLTAVREELIASFIRALGSRCSLEEITNLEFFCEQFEIEELRNLLRKLLEFVEEGQVVDFLDNMKPAIPRDAESASSKEPHKGDRTSPLLHSNRPVKYAASPAKAVLIERQSSSECEETSYSSEEDGPSSERSRPLKRSITPRRSASPMRKVQIGRSGSRRTPAITIKSLNSFPVRDKALHYKTTSSNDDVEVAEPAKKTEVNVTRMSVQDAISLFESKQRNLATDVQKRSLVENPGNVQKSVLRRWSSSVRESSAQHVTQEASQHHQDTTSISNRNPGYHGYYSNHATRVGTDIKFSSADQELAEDAPEISGKQSADPCEADIPVSGPGEIDRLDTADWNRQKEAELNQMLMKFMQTAQDSTKNAMIVKSKDTNRRSGQRGGLYDEYKEKRDVKLRGENSVKRSDQLATSKTMQKCVAKMKTESTSTSKDATDLGKKTSSVSRTQKRAKNTPQTLNSKRESPKPVLPKKASAKPSPMPATRKSWPSTPSPWTTSTSPAIFVGGTTSGSAALRQKSRSSSSVSRPVSKLERSQLQQKDVKKGQVETKRNLKTTDENKRQAAPNSGIVAKKKVLAASGDNTAKVSVKPGLRSKATKKSSVVPLESKPTMRKGPGRSPANSPCVKMKTTPNVEESLDNCRLPSQLLSDAAVTLVSDQVFQPAEMVPMLQQSDIPDVKPQTEVESHSEHGEIENPCEIPADGDFADVQMPASLEEIQPEEPTISLSTWVEDDKQVLPIPSGAGASQIVVSRCNTGTMSTSGPRVRHSLAQMLLEETSEPDIIEWGNAENLPAIVYHKDAPKGLKRLLKFARKSRDVNQTGWSSPCTSEGEDDSDDSKTFVKRSSEDLRKLALHAKYGQQGTSFEAFDSELLSARPNASNGSGHSLSKFHEGNGSSTGNNKANRSFFSLSAFRGNKAAETKLH